MTGLAAAVLGARDGRAAADNMRATDPLTGVRPFGWDAEVDPEFAATCEALGYPVWGFGDLFPYRTTAGVVVSVEVATLPLPLRHLATETVPIAELVPFGAPVDEVAR